MSEGGCLLQTEDEKKNKKRQSPVDDRPAVPSPSEAMLNSEFHIPTKCFHIISSINTSLLQFSAQWPWTWKFNRQCIVDIGRAVGTFRVASHRYTYYVYIE